jgi:hypothetical protein
MQRGNILGDLGPCSALVYMSGAIGSEEMPFINGHYILGSESHG